MKETREAWQKQRYKNHWRNKEKKQKKEEPTKKREEIQRGKEGSNWKRNKTWEHADSSVHVKFKSRHVINTHSNFLWVSVYQDLPYKVHGFEFPCAFRLSLWTWPINFLEHIMAGCNPWNPKTHINAELFLVHPGLVWMIMYKELHSLDIMILIVYFYCNRLLELSVVSPWKKWIFRYRHLRPVYFLF